MRLVRQRFDVTQVDDLGATLAAKVRSRLQEVRLPAGARVAIGVGSRGVSPIVEVVRAVAAELRAAGADPFVVPAMGCHGGARAEGQVAVLKEYGVEERTVGVPVRATMDTVSVGRTQSGVEVYLDAMAAEADGIVVIGRVKPHTCFRARVESGLCKMLVVGLGKWTGAQSIHSYGLGDIIAEAAEVATRNAKILFGVALVENAFDRPCVVEVAPPERFVETDARLLEIAHKVMARLPIDRLEVLVIDRIGKDISGTGMDPNVIGMWRRIRELPQEPFYRWLVALGLTEAAQGNANGMGLADLVSQKLVDAIDPGPMITNALTGMAPSICSTPIAFPTDLACYEVALELGRRTAGGTPRVARIANTLQLETFWVSENVLPDLPTVCAVASPAGQFAFTADGWIIEANAFAPAG